MKSKEKEELQKLLRKLLQSVYSICVEGLTENRFKPESRFYNQRWTHESKYGDNGTHITSWTEKKPPEMKWHEATITIEQEIKKASLYNEALTKIGSIYGIEEKECDYYLSIFINVVASKILESEITNKASLEPYILLFLRELNQEEQTYKITAKIKGIILEPESIQLDNNTLLRKPTEGETYPGSTIIDSLYERKYDFNTPSAIVELTGMSPPNLVGMKDVLEVNILISILSLFRVGGVEFIEYGTHIDSMFPSTGISTKKIYLLKSGDYLVKNEDVEPLKLFWSKMKRATLPSSVYVGKQKKPDELSIAYDRYRDSLERGIVEKRISSAVMGLEALYLGEDPQDRGELRYKLGMRVGKLLSLVGYSPSEAKQKTRDAYDIRSTYVHGGTLKQKGRQKYEKKYGDLNEFCKTITDYLRASIVALLKIPSKNSFIQKIDDSFLDGKKEEEVKNLLFMSYEKET